MLLRKNVDEVRHLEAVHSNAADMPGGQAGLADRVIGQQGKSAKARSLASRDPRMTFVATEHGMHEHHSLTLPLQTAW